MQTQADQVVFQSEYLLLISEKDDHMDALDITGFEDGSILIDYVQFQGDEVNKEFPNKNEALAYIDEITDPYERIDCQTEFNFICEHEQCE